MRLTDETTRGFGAAARGDADRPVALLRHTGALAVLLLVLLAALALGALVR